MKGCMEIDGDDIASNSLMQFDKILIIQCTTCSIIAEDDQVNSNRGRISFIITNNFFCDLIINTS